MLKYLFFDVNTLSSGMLETIVLLLQCVVIIASGIIIVSLFIQIYQSLFERDSFVPFMPADGRAIEAMISTGYIKKHHKVIDLGSGTGDIVLRVAEKTGAEVTGIEINVGLWFLSRVRKMFSPAKKRIRFLRGDVRKINLKEYDVVLIFLTSNVLENYLNKKFETELKSGAKILSYVFKANLPSFIEEKVSVGRKGFWDDLYIYTKK